jgi:hypothetical protein
VIDESDRDEFSFSEQCCFGMNDQMILHSLTEEQGVMNGLSFQVKESRWFCACIQSENFTILQSLIIILRQTVLPIYLNQDASALYSYESLFRGNTYTL